MRRQLMQLTGSALLLVGILLVLRGFRAVENPGMTGSPSLALIGSPVAVLGLIMFVATLWDTVVVVERSRVIRAAPERAWSLLSSPAMWSLRPGRFAFDVTAAEAGRLRVSLRADSRRVGGDVLEVAGEEPGRSVSLRTAGVTGPGAVMFTFSVVPDGDRVVAVIRARNTVRRGTGLDVRAGWRRQLKAWLAECSEVLEGRRPWPEDSPPADVRAAWAKHRVPADAPSVSANALIGAPPAVVWPIMEDPATDLRLNPGTVAVGTVPGTPPLEPGEMQWEIRRLDDGRLRPCLSEIQERAKERSAKVLEILPLTSEILYRIEPEAGGTRLTLTCRYPAGTRTSKQQEELASGISDIVNRYKTLIEEADGQSASDAARQPSGPP